MQGLKSGGLREVSEFRDFERGGTQARRKSAVFLPVREQGKKQRKHVVSL